MANQRTILQAMPFAELNSAAEQVAALQASPAWAFLQQLVAKEKERLVERMTNPSLPSYEALAKLTGEIKGLTAAFDAADKVLEVAEERRSELDRQAAEAAAQEA